MKSKWLNERLGEVCRAAGGGTPSRRESRFWNGAIPWASVKDFKEGQRFIEDTEEHITEIGLASSASRLIPSGTPLVCTRMAVGRSAIPLRDVAINQDVKSLFTTGRIGTNYLQRLLEFHEADFGRTAVGSTVKGISTGELLSFRISFPEQRAEQSCLAEILDTLDAAICETEAVVSKLRQMKAGLLHDLLTRGLDEHSHLRDPTRHPEQFQDTPLGRTPKAWEIRPCESLCREIVVGIVVKPAQYHRVSGVPVLRSANVRENGIDFSDLVFISEKSNRELRKSMLRAGDVVTVRTGYPGTCALIPPSLDGCNCVDLIVARPAPEIVPEFLVLWINSPLGKDQVLRNQGGLAQQHFNVGELKLLLVANAPADEQKTIVEITEQSARQQQAYLDRLSKLLSLKRGLAHDLLTGRVRVKV